MAATFETDVSIGPGGSLLLQQLPFPEGWMVHVRVEQAAGKDVVPQGFALGLHEGMVEVPDDFNDPLPEAFWLGKEGTV